MKGENYKKPNAHDRAGRTACRGGWKSFKKESRRGRDRNRVADLTTTTWSQTNYVRTTGEGENEIG